MELNENSAGVAWEARPPHAHDEIRSRNSKWHVKREMKVR